MDVYGTYKSSISGVKQTTTWPQRQKWATPHCGPLDGTVMSVSAVWPEYATRDRNTAYTQCFLVWNSKLV